MLMTSLSKKAGVMAMILININALLARNLMYFCEETKSRLSTLHISIDYQSNHC